MPNPRYHEILWVANTQDAGQYVFSWDYKEDSWTTYTFGDNVTGLGAFNF
jgi:hypothetical protein